jgi:hypothetical protein
VRLLVLLSLIIISIFGIIHERGFLKVNQVEVTIEEGALNKSPYWGGLLSKVSSQMKEFENKNIWQIP